MKRAVSDVIGFSLMFSVIILGVALVSTAGFGQLAEISDQERVGAGERGMEAFAGNLDDVARQGDLARSVDLAPSGGLIWYRNSAIEINVSDSTESVLHDDTYDVNSLEHRFSRPEGFVSVNYESGAVMRSDGGGAITNPRMRCDQDRSTAVLTLVSLRGSDSLSLGDGFGSGTGVPRPPDLEGVPGDGSVVSTERTVRFGASHEETRMGYSNFDDTTSETVVIDVSNSANPETWSHALYRASGWEPADPDDYEDPNTVENEWECESVETIVVREVLVTLSADS